MHGMPPHIAELVAGHRDINVTMGYKAVYPEEVINGHRAFITRRRVAEREDGRFFLRNQCFPPSAFAAGNGVGELLLGVVLRV